MASDRDDSGSRSRSPRREKKHKKERRSRRDRSGERDSRRDRDRRRSRRSRSRRRSRERRSRSRSGGRGRDERRGSRRSRTPQRSGRMYKDLTGREFRDQRSRQYPSRSRSFGKVRNKKKKNENEEEEPSASLMIQQMLAQKTNPMLVSMMGPTAASMGPGMGLTGVFSPPAAAAPEAEPEVAPESRVLVLENAVEANELKDDQEYNDLLEDMKEEAEKHGTVLKVVIPRPVEGQQVPGVGKVFIVFDFDAGAGRAQKSLNGRKFGDSVVKCSYIDEAKFDAQEY